jgi:hypothetical protein
MRDTVRKTWVAGAIRSRKIDLSALMSALIDRLDSWVVQQKAPPPSQVVAPPEIAAPLGVYFPFPTELGTARVGLQTTGFAAFDGTNPEPLDGLGRPIDMNGSGKHERRETHSAAWARLGLIAPGALVDRGAYIARVSAVAEKLAADGLIHPAAVPWYFERARSALIIT